MLLTHANLIYIYSLGAEIIDRLINFYMAYFYEIVGGYLI